MKNETVQIGPINWKEAATIIRVALEHGTSEGKAMAIKELRNMAEVADLSGELFEQLKSLREVLLKEGWVPPRGYSLADCDKVMDKVKS